MTEAVIFIPGIMGSVLQDGDEVIWPGKASELLFPYKHMAELQKPGLVASDVIRSFSIVSQYDHLFEMLANCQYNEHGARPTLKVFPYDWRKDNALAAAALADVVDKMVLDLGADVEINLLAHSMGGLVSRCYLESGLYSARAGFARIKRLITMGTPHRGSPIALTAAVGQEKRLFLNAQQVMQIANDTNFPSLYQLMPPRGEPFVWDRRHEARYDPLDVYEPALANKIGLVAANLSAAKKFHAMLDLNRRPAHVRYFFFAGTRQATASAIQLSVNAAKATVYKIDRDDGGDGTVPIWSASQSGVQMEPVGGEHGELYKNGGLRSVLCALLGKPGVAGATGLIPELSVAEKVVEPGSVTRVTVDFPLNTLEVDGALNLRRVVDASGVKRPEAAVIRTFPISYGGTEIDHLSVLIELPDYAGVYELSYVPKGSAVPLAMTELFVQTVYLG